MRAWQRLWLALCLVGSAALGMQGLFGAQGWQHRQRLLVELGRVEGDNAALSAHIAQMQRRIDGLAHSPMVQQHAVRDGLGWVRPGEWVVHLPPLQGHDAP